MKNTLLGGLGVVLAIAGPASGSIWTVSGASIGGVSESVASMRSGVIDIDGGIQDALDDEFDNLFSTPVLNVNTLAFFAFEDTGGTEYFGFYWLSDSARQLTFSATATGASGLETNTSFSASPVGQTFTSAVGGDSYFYLYEGVGAGSTISMSGLVPNLEIQWLDWDGSAWQLLGSGARTGVSPGDESFALAGVSTTAIPGAGVAGVGGLGLAGRLLGRRRIRQSCR